jgi:ABC-type dipeptide/oligopeptide/nickel transport system permease component
MNTGSWIAVIVAVVLAVGVGVFIAMKAGKGGDKKP